FRPLPATKMEKHPPPDPNYVLKILESTSSAMRRYGLKLELNKAGCVRCSACSPLKEALKYGL
ncbi:MAG: hypothetical protein N3E48_02040, partial [Candidatus Bathyarchaeota archaeon]|nr:hypothetical protein [Candidatus Bathyarchaeota archaeon]